MMLVSRARRPTVARATTPTRRGQRQRRQPRSGRSSRSAGGTGSAMGGAGGGGVHRTQWPTVRWQRVQATAHPSASSAEVSPVPTRCDPAVMAAVTSGWQYRQASSVTARLWSLMRMGSGKSPVVKAKECQNPFDAFVRYFPTRSCGVWQSSQTATALWLDFTHEAKWASITWQFAHAAGSFVRYDAPFARSE